MDFSDYIIEYCEGQLDVSTKNAFEKAMISDPGLTKAVLAYREGMQISEGLLEIDIMETISGLAENDDSIGEVFKVIKRRFFFQKVAAVALILGLGILSWWLVAPSSSLITTQKKIWASYFKPVDTEATKSIDTVDMNTFQLGKYYFALNDFENSEAKFRSFLNQTKVKDSLNLGYFWLGSACLEQWNLIEARKAWRQSNHPKAQQNLHLLDSKLK